MPDLILPSWQFGKSFRYTPAVAHTNLRFKACDCHPPMLTQKHEYVHKRVLIVHQLLRFIGCEEAIIIILSVQFLTFLGHNAEFGDVHISDA